MLDSLRPWQVSFLYHLLFLGLMTFFIYFRPQISETYEIPIAPLTPSAVQNLTEVKKDSQVVLKSVNEPLPKEGKVREIFGASRDSYTDTGLGEEGIDAKRGNTLAKAVDQEKLLDTDVTGLPIPTEEYLVSEMPVVLSEVRPLYPQVAKEKQLEGAVALDVLIDDKGVVRQVSVIEGQEIFRQGAIEAMKKFRFRPARVEGKAVAVRIRYTLNFKLEY